LPDLRSSPEYLGESSDAADPSRDQAIAAVEVAREAAKVFIALWLVAAGINMWVGVSRAGYSVAEEAPIFVVVFAVPAVIALLVLWLLSRG